MEFQDIQNALKGKEVEENWEQREKAIARVSQMAESGCKFPSFVTLLKTVYEPILNSVRMIECLSLVTYSLNTHSYVY